MLKVQSVQDNKSIFLENGSLFVTKEELNAIDLKSLIPKTELILKNLDKFRLKSVIIILLTIIVATPSCDDVLCVADVQEYAHERRA